MPIAKTVSPIFKSNLFGKSIDLRLPSFIFSTAKSAYSSKPIKLAIYVFSSIFTVLSVPESIWKAVTM